MHVLNAIELNSLGSTAFCNYFDANAFFTVMLSNIQALKQQQYIHLLVTVI